MAGTKLGGLKAAVTNKERHGNDFYEQIGYKSHAAWVKNGRKPRGFSANKELARTAGRLGGLKSRRKK